MTVVAMIVGCAYAALLWQIARVVSAQRKLALGRIPYLAVIASGACAAASSALAPGTPPLLLSAGVIGAIICGVADARTGYIFDGLTAAMAVIALSIAAETATFPAALLSGGVVGGCMLLLYAITRGRGIGLGDVKLAAALGLSFGMAFGVIAVGAAFVFGAVYGITLLVRHRATRSDAIRFGPFMAAGAVFALAIDLAGIRA